MNKKSMLFVLASAAGAFVFGCGAKNDASDAGTEPPADSGVTSEGGGDSATTNDSTPNDAADSSTTTDSGTTTDGGGGDSATATSCSTGTLFAGNPVYGGDPLDRPASGTGIHADPPFQWEELVFTGTMLYSRDEGELWGTDLSATSPVETRVAGLNDPTAYAYAPGPCASARLAKIRGIAALSDGSLVVADSLGNAVLHVTNPTTSACNVEVLAGNATANPDIDPTTAGPGAGDVDGPGATAQLSGPAAIVTDGAGNVYFFDGDNRKLKKIGNDAAHTVKTLAALDASGPDKLFNLAFLGSKIYGVGIDGANVGYVLAYDSTTGAKSTVLSGGSDAFPPVESGASPDLAGITTDGTGLIVSGDGYVWYLTTSGTLTQLAGTGPSIDFPPAGYDPAASHAALDLVLTPSRAAAEIGSFDYITYFKGAVYYRGHADGTSAYVEKIACP